MSNEIKLSPVAKRKGIEAIDATYKLQGELTSLANTLEDRTVTASEHIYGLARWAMGEHRDPAQGVQLFSAICADAEATLKARLGVDNLKKALPVWSVFKSNVMRGLRLGLDVNEYKTEWQFREAVREHVNANRTEPEPKTATAEDMTEFLGSTTIAAPLQFLLTQINLEAEYVKPANVKKAQELMRTFAEDLRALIDVRRIQDDATKQLLGEDENATSHADTAGNTRRRPGHVAVRRRTTGARTGGAHQHAATG
jgi:hypothetical protein